MGAPMTFPCASMTQVQKAGRASQQLKTTFANFLHARGQNPLFSIFRHQAGILWTQLTVKIQYNTGGKLKAFFTSALAISSTLLKG